MSIANKCLSCFSCFRPSCPVCNSLFRRRYRIFLNIGEEDVEQFLLTNPRIFANLVERNQHILNEHQQQRQQSQQQQEQQQQQNQEDQHNEENGNNANRHGNSDDEDSEDILAIPHLGLCMRVDQHGISFRPLRQ